MTQAAALALSLAVELPIMLLLARQAPRLRVMLLACFATTATHPAAWWAASLLSPHDYPAGLIYIEAAVILAEATFYWLGLQTGWWRALLWSALANGGSFALGWLAHEFY